MAYTPPEYILGTRPDRRGDIFALGVVLWELLTNKRLFFRSTNAAIVHAIIRENVRPPSDLAPLVPSELDSVIMTALSKDPEERWITARAMGIALGRVLEEMGGAMTSRDVAKALSLEFSGLFIARQEVTTSMPDRELSDITVSKRWSGEASWSDESALHDTMEGYEVDLDGLEDPIDDGEATEVDAVPPFADEDGT
jgi:serine/threonine protein kinase